MLAGLVLGRDTKELWELAKMVKQRIVEIQDQWLEDLYLGSGEVKRLTTVLGTEG